jgi:exodeoxyribonuclease V alpha subunit
LLKSAPVGFDQRNQENPLECDLLILDECSMVDLLDEQCAQALHPASHLLLVTTPTSCPVSALNVLHDLIASQVMPVTRLNVIFRQAASSIITVLTASTGRCLFPERSARFLLLR